jgi:hypothetical protein
MRGCMTVLMRVSLIGSIAVIHGREGKIVIFITCLCVELVVIIGYLS